MYSRPFKGVGVTQHRADLHVKIGVMLGQRPDRKDQVMRIDRRDPARLLPAAQDGCLFIHQRAQFIDAQDVLRRAFLAAGRTARID